MESAAANLSAEDVDWPDRSWAFSVKRPKPFRA
jgi:hypothetical protein